MVNQSLNVVTWDNLRAHSTNSSPRKSGQSAPRLSASLLLSFAIYLPLGFDSRLNPEIDRDGEGAAIPTLTASGKPAKVDPRQETANNILLEHVPQDRVSIGISFAGIDFEPQNPKPVADEPALIAPEIYQKAKALGSVRVIVELRLAPHREDSESSRENAIRMAQKALLDELAQVNLRVIRSYSSIPAIVLAASIDALKIIAASRHVTHVTEDGLSIPF
ncbi:MAG: hypothetical protein ACXW48_22205 [Candidatus Binatia bacterium]